MQTVPELDGLIMTPIQDEDGNIQNDKGKHVRITTVGGPIYDRREKKDVIVGNGHAIFNEPGKVAKGPYLLTISGRVAVKGSKGKKYKEVKVTTEPYWLVRLDCNGFFLHFAESELTFV